MGAYLVSRQVLESIKATIQKARGQWRRPSGYYKDCPPIFKTFGGFGLKDDQERIIAGPITVPTLALHGTRDRPRRIDAFESETMDRYFTGGLEKVIIPGTGHFMHQEKPEEVNPRIVEFLKR